ncbi:hypothetical protein NQ317_003151 [Molorchus minor]|uniref:MRN complex-interacting protein N-terminal domain-containing protein n=1 Tax=Molorchus minor TaxID=1323400 RepID=A0ABQ9JYB6_9CUCU|nr:hypothetical protein NQ317_003151 [Molorchus minor]
MFYGFNLKEKIFTFCIEKNKMPQEFQVLQCYCCQTFQVDIVKKVLKWSCKMCGEKQSVKKIFAKGSGKDCRLHVQELNTMRIKAEGEVPKKASYDSVNVDIGVKYDEATQSEWSKFMEFKEDENMDTCYGNAGNVDRKAFSRVVLRDKNDKDGQTECVDVKEEMKIVDAENLNKKERFFKLKKFCEVGTQNGLARKDTKSVSTENIIPGNKNNLKVYKRSIFENDCDLDSLLDI